jgi:lysophospholipase L1-like esterase
MKKIYPFILSLIVLHFVVVSVVAQDTAFLKDIQKFKKHDSISFPPKNAIVFVGSSSFTKWQDVQSYFPNYKIINRGFGGSTLPDVIHYANDIILPYHPKQVIIYCGDNDLASSDTITPQIVTSRFKTLFHVIRKNLPATNIAFISIKPSPSRKQLMPKMEQANRLIKSFLQKQKNTSFIDVYHPMLLPDGRPMGQIFLEDSLHMNAKGYAIWKKAIQPHLIKK